MRDGGYRVLRATRPRRARRAMAWPSAHAAAVSIEGSRAYGTRGHRVTYSRARIPLIRQTQPTLKRNPPLRASVTITHPRTHFGENRLSSSQTSARAMPARAACHSAVPRRTRLAALHCSDPRTKEEEFANHLRMHSKKHVNRNICIAR